MNSSVLAGLLPWLLYNLVFFSCCSSLAECLLQNKSKLSLVVISAILCLSSHVPVKDSRCACVLRRSLSCILADELFFE